jgi:Flp pilus assembly protein TadD
LYQDPAQAQSAEAVAKVAQAITVRIEGATQGSGVLVKREGNRYTVLTAWHVVSGQRPGEELDIYTPDGQRHQMEQGSIKRLGEVDMAVLTFNSTSSYGVAPIGDVKSVSSGSSIYVSGFPLPTSAVPTRLFRFLKGDVIANATVAIPNGYQLLYSNQTLPGMSGGAVLNAQGQLVGIHGQGETDSKMSVQQGVAVKTGTNQAVPIAYYRQYASGAAVVASTAQAITADDYLAQAKALLNKKDSEQEVIRLSAQALAIRQSSEAYFYRAYAKSALGDKQGAIADYNQAIAINPRDSEAYYNRGNAKSDLGDKQGAIADYNQAIAIIPRFSEAYCLRGNAKDDLGDKQGAIADFNQAIAINPKYSEAYFLRGTAKGDLGDKQGACSDYKMAASLGDQDAKQWLNSNNGAWCRNMP